LEGQNKAGSGTTRITIPIIYTLRTAIYLF